MFLFCLYSDNLLPYQNQEQSLTSPSAIQNEQQQEITTTHSNGSNLDSILQNGTNTEGQTNDTQEDQVHHIHHNTNCFSR